MDFSGGLLLSQYWYSRSAFRYLTASHCLADSDVTAAALGFLTTIDNGFLTSRFSQDIELIDTELPWVLMNLIMNVFVVAGQMVWLESPLPIFQCHSRSSCLRSLQFNAFIFEHPGNCGYSILNLKARYSKFVWRSSRFQRSGEGGYFHWEAQLHLFMSC